MLRVDPSAFLSYAHVDDRDSNKITTWYRCLASTVAQLTGAPFPVHCDRDFIGPGQDWAKEILNHLRRSMFLMPVVSPAYFRSDYCRFEVDQFLELERRRGRSGLIIPFYYQEAPQLSDPGQRGDALVALLHARQYYDLRPLATLDTNSAAFTDLVDRVAEAVAAAIRRLLAAGPIAESPPEPERPQRVVDAAAPGAGASIAAAIAAAQPGERVLVRPGLYRESIVIDKPLELVGDGEAGEIVIEGAGADTLVFDAPRGRIANLTLRQAPSEESAAHCVVILSGHPVIEHCTISSRSLSCVAVRGKADPVIRDSRIVHGTQFGVVFEDDASGLIEACEIADHSIANLLIRERADPVARRNRIERGATFAVAVRDEAAGLIEDNDIGGCENSVVTLSDDASPTLRGNRIRGGRNFGVSVDGRATPLLEGNEIADNANCGIVIQGPSNPTLRHNRVHDNRNFGLSIQGETTALVEDNEFARNRRVEIHVGQGASPTVRKNVVRDATNYAISIDSQSAGVFEDNDIRASNRAGIAIADRSRPAVRGNTIADGKGFGLLVTGGAEGRVEDNLIVRSGLVGVWISKGAKPLLCRNRVIDGRGTGLAVMDGSGGRFEDNEIAGNAKAGVHLEASAEATLLRNRIAGNGGFAIEVAAPCAATIEGNDLRGNAKGAWSRPDAVNEKGRISGNTE